MLNVGLWYPPPLSRIFSLNISIHFFQLIPFSVGSSFKSELHVSPDHFWIVIGVWTPQKGGGEVSIVTAPWGVTEHTYPTSHIALITGSSDTHSSFLGFQTQLGQNLNTNTLCLTVQSFLEKDTVTRVSTIFWWLKDST